MLLGTMNLSNEVSEIVSYVMFALLGVIAWIVALRLIQEGISDVQRAKLLDQEASQFASSDCVSRTNPLSPAARI